MSIFHAWIKGDRDKAVSNSSGFLTLDEILVELARFGEVTLCRMRNGLWWCYLEMQKEGVSMRVKSESDHTTPYSAALQCADRLSDLQPRSSA